VISQRQGGGVPGRHSRGRGVTADGGKHPGRQVHPEDRPGMPAAGQFGEVGAVSAADVGDGLLSVQGGEVEHHSGQVDPRVLAGVEGLPGGQAGVGAVLHLLQAGPVGPQPGAVTVHQQQQ
jgi:hypothetical protein